MKPSRWELSTRSWGYLSTRSAPRRNASNQAPSTHWFATTSSGSASDLDNIPPGPALAMVGNAAIELVRALIVSTGADPDRQHSAITDSLPLRITLYLGDHLRDPSLTPAKIAAVHHISLRQLYNVWSRTNEQSLGQWIITQRLDAARGELARPDVGRSDHFGDRPGTADSSTLPTLPASSVKRTGCRLASGGRSPAKIDHEAPGLRPPAARSRARVQRDPARAEDTSCTLGRYRRARTAIPSAGSSHPAVCHPAADHRREIRHDRTASTPHSPSGR